MSDHAALVARLRAKCFYDCGEPPLTYHNGCTDCETLRALDTLAREKAEALRQRDEIRLVADGLVHDWTCEHDAAANPGPGFVCLRCQRDAAEQATREARAETWEEAADMICCNREHGGVLFAVVEDMQRRARAAREDTPT